MSALETAPADAPAPSVPVVVAADPSDPVKPSATGGPSRAASLEAKGHPALHIASVTAWTVLVFDLIVLGAPWYQESGRVRQPSNLSATNPIAVWSSLWSTWVCEDTGSAQLTQDMPRHTCALWANYDRPDAVTFLFRGLSTAAAFTVVATAVAAAAAFTTYQLAWGIYRRNNKCETACVVSDSQHACALSSFYCRREIRHLIGACKSESPAPYPRTSVSCLVVACSATRQS
jgi:hypothetical protein